MVYGRFTLEEKKMGKAKFDRVELTRMLREGKSQTEIAEKFGVSKMAISKAAKEVGIAVSRHVATRQVPELVQEHIKVSQQLVKINSFANELLERAMAVLRGDKDALPIPESETAQRMIRFGNREEIAKEYRSKDPSELAIKLMETIKGQLSLQVEIFKTMYSAEAMKAFQEAFLRVLARKDPETREEIILELQKERIFPAIP
jgi:hypothetical protein